MARIYTGSGDKGETSLASGRRTSKDDPRVIAYGELDELTSFIGLALSFVDDQDIRNLLQNIQKDIFAIGAEIAAEGKKPSLLRRAISEDDVKRLEAEIDRFQSELAPLKQFILPGGCIGSAVLQVARAVCRRTERSIVSLNKKEPINNQILVYLNRLSDLLFVLARQVNKSEGVDEAYWE